MLRRTSRTAAVAAAVVAAAAACGQSPPPVPAAAPGALFCRRLDTAMVLSGEIEDQQGYPRLVAAYESAIAVAPAGQVADLTTLATYYRSGYRTTTPSGPNPHDARRRLIDVRRNRCP